MCKKISSYDVMFEILYLGYHELASDIFYNHKLELKDIMEAIATRLEYIYIRDRKDLKNIRREDVRQIFSTWSDNHKLSDLITSYQHRI